MPIRVFEIKLPVDHDADDLPRAVARALDIPRRDLLSWVLRREAIDARKKNAIHFSYAVDATVRNEASVMAGRHAAKIAKAPDDAYLAALPGSEALRHRPVVVGTGPAGLFAGLALARAGYRPLLLERGRAVEDRVRDVEGFWREGRLDPESNAQFGEGGAGTFSDGKLTTLINDPRCSLVLRELVEAGAPESILAASKPHIGTDALRNILVSLRATIIGLGGEFRFSSRLSGLRTDGSGLVGLEINDGDFLPCELAILAIGHSADDTIAMLFETGVAMQQKPFAVGLRIEHPQPLIDVAQYGAYAGHPRLGPADYKLAFHAEGGRSAYTFCMCPGGEVVAAASRETCLVTNGMSYSARDGRNANAALLVNVDPADFPSTHTLAGFEFQRHWERLAYALGGGDFHAPVQLAGDFVANRLSSSFGAVTPTYRPGVRFANLREALPVFVSETLIQALPHFGRRIQGFDRSDALLTGVETRSSSPVRFTRGEDFQASVPGLYPAGEGAGYAGGIMSAAADGIRVAESLIRRYARPSFLS